MPTSSVDLLSVIPGLQIGASDIIQSELFLTQTLQAADPTLDLRQGTAIRDLAVRPSATLLATINKALIYYWTQNSLATVTDSTPAAFVDNILSNYFMTRYQGANAVINARLYFAKNTSVTLTTNIYFSIDNVSKYFPASNATYSSLSLDAPTGTYYVDVDLVAEATGTTYNITAGSLVYFGNFNPYFLHAEVNYLSSLATNVETNTQYIARAETAISTRNLINNPSIISNLQSTFKGIVSDIVTVGMGDSYMLRDMAMVWPDNISAKLWIHLGGCTDIYCNVPLTTSVSQFTTDTNSKVVLTGPIYDIAISGVPGGSNTDVITPGMTYSLTNNNVVIANPTTITLTGRSATVVLDGHGFKVGERILVAGVDQPEYNGLWTIVTVPDINSFTYLLTAFTLPVSPATGTPVVTAVARTGDVGFSTRQSITVDFTQSARSTAAITGVTFDSGANVLNIHWPNHGWVNGSQVSISGWSHYNGANTITVGSTDSTSLPTTDYFNIPSPVDYSSGLSYATGYMQLVTANQSVSIELKYFQDIDGIQTYLGDPANRVLAADQLARGFNLTKLDITIVGYGNTSPDQALATTTVAAYLKSLLPGQIFIMGDLLAALSATGIGSIKTPIGVSYTRYTRDLFGTVTDTITDVFDPADSTNVFILNSLTTSSMTPP